MSSGRNPLPVQLLPPGVTGGIILEEGLPRPILIVRDELEPQTRDGGKNVRQLLHAASGTRSERKVIAELFRSEIFHSC